MLVQPNQNFRSSSKNPAERKSVEDSFAKSILWGFTVAAESNNRVLVDATQFFLRDMTNAANSLRPGNYRVDPTRSAFYLPNTRNFPKNTEVDVTLTFVNDAGGRRRWWRRWSDPGSDADWPVRSRRRVAVAVVVAAGSVAACSRAPWRAWRPTANAVTLREHASLVELPDNNYTPRVDDPRAGYGGLTFLDYSAPVGEPMQMRYIRRHRLQKKDPSAAISEPIKPIQYWVDNGAPEDVKKALLEGANWWNQAFEAAGFRNAFKVDVLPTDADPMDIRYNMINWVHRSTRGWSSGGSVSDPRTGEIIRATVTLGSLRDRQDYMIFEGLLSPYAKGDERPAILYDTALARIRQLSAHEVGHTLGLGHNYYDSKTGWISVMDYPHPYEELKADGTIDLTKAYTAHIGEWDKVAINFGYREFPQGRQRRAGAAQDPGRCVGGGPALLHEPGHRHPSARRAVVERRQPGRRADAADAGAAGGAQSHRPEHDPLGHADGDDRRAAGADLHVSPLRGGSRGVDDRRPGLHLRDARRRQRHARWCGWTAKRSARRSTRSAATLKPSELALPKNILELIPPRPPGYGMHRELFPRTTGEGFDPINPAAIAADVTIGFVLQPDRAARMVAQNAIDQSKPGLGEVIDKLIRASFDQPTTNTYEAAIRRAVERALVDRVMWLAAVAPNSQVRAIASMKLQRLAARLSGTAPAARPELDIANYTLLAADVNRFLERPAETWRVIATSPAPPGAPIGDVGQNWLARPEWCVWDENAPSAWMFYQSPS